MSEQFDRASGTGTEQGAWWLGGVLGGVAGALAFGAVMWVLTPETLRASIPALYGIAPTSGVGWAIHLAHGVVLGVVYGAVVQTDAVTGALDAAIPDATDAARDAVLGLFYGVAIWAILPVLIAPVWFGVVGTTDPGTLSGVAPPILVGHLLYGALLGVVYGIAVER